MTRRERIQFGDTTIEYEVRRSARRKKTLQISVEGGVVRVSAPMRTPNRELRDFVRKRAPWIIEQKADEQATALPARFASGETLPYLGRDVPMLVKDADGETPKVRFSKWRFHITAPGIMRGSERYERIRHAIEAWYRDRAAERLPVSIEKWMPRFGCEVEPQLLIRNQKRRWASCSSDGKLRFNWRVMMLEPWLIDYIVAHELAHLTHMNHSADFWGLVAKVMPDMQLRRQRLKEATLKLQF